MALVVLALGSAASGAPKAPPPSLATLLARHVPILVLHPAESFEPVPVDGFLTDSDLEQKSSAGVWEKLDEPLPVGGAALRLDQRLCSARDGVAAIRCYADAEAAYAPVPTTYGAAFRRGNRIALQYWLFYPYDAYSPTVPAGQIWQVHEGDWESVSVILDNQGTPLLVGLSRHSGGARRDWAHAPKRGQRPLVYVALGSHANYFGPGIQLFSPLYVPRELIQIIRSLGALPADHTGRGRVIRPSLVRIDATTPSWMTFAGTWGEDQYLHAPGNDPVVFGAGPRGPAFHDQWRRPISDVLSWPAR
jgi:Vacuolar protein sorting-associated protein 62